MRKRLTLNDFINECRACQENPEGYIVEHGDNLLSDKLCNGHKVAISGWQIGHAEIDDVLVSLTHGIGVGSQYYDDPIDYIITLLAKKGDKDPRIN